MKKLSDREFQEQLEGMQRGEPLPDSISPEDAADLSLAGRFLALRARPGPQLEARVQKALAETAPAPRGLRFPRLSWKWRFPLSTSRVWRRIAWAAIALLLLLSITMAAFPSARAAVLNWIQRIGGLPIVETEQYPRTAEERQGGWLSLYGPSGGTTGTPLPETLVSLAEARATLPFTFTIPTWVPDSFALQDQVRLILPTDGFSATIALLTWENGKQEQLLLSVVHDSAADEHALFVGPGKVQTVQVGGHEAALVRGAWNIETERYEATDMLDLRWKEGSVFYSLVGWEKSVSVGDLIRIAESMR